MEGAGRSKDKVPIEKKYAFEKPWSDPVLLIRRSRLW